VRSLLDSKFDPGRVDHQSSECDETPRLSELRPKGIVDIMVAAYIQMIEEGVRLAWRSDMEVASVAVARQNLYNQHRLVMRLLLSCP
jgi:hypothetical protein